MATTLVAFQIEKGVPVPAVKTGSRRPFTMAVEAALPQMREGDSFTYKDDSKHGSQSTAVREVAKRLGVKITLRKVGSGEYRVWRTA